MGMIKKALMMGIALALVAGCAAQTSGSSEPSALSASLRGLVQSISGTRAKAPPPPQLTRALLSEVGGRVLEVTVYNREQRAYLVPIAQRRDRLPGEIVLWQTTDQVGVNLRAGLLTSTRALGGDLASSDLTSVQAAVQARGGTAQRVQFFGTGDRKARRLVSQCQIEAAGTERIWLLDRVHDAQVLHETCQAEGGAFRNTYWLDPASGMIVQSRQWAGPAIGYLGFKLFT